MKNTMTMLLLAAALGCHKNQVTADCVERANDGRACTLDYTPVCGCNGKTYPNACAAEAVGITKYTAGECDAGK